MDNSIIDSIQPEAKYASFWMRVAASLIDGIILLPVTSLIFWNQYEYTWRSYEMFIGLIFISSFYKPFMEWKFGGTFGKLILKMRVLSTDFQPISLNQSMMRWIHYFAGHLMQYFAITETLELLGDYQFKSIVEMGEWQQEMVEPDILGTIISLAILVFGINVAFDKVTRRGLHDLIANTVVISTKKDEITSRTN